MENNLHRLVEAINASNNTTASIPDLMRFLLGEKTPDLSDKSYYSIYKNEGRSLSASNQRNLMLSTDWSLNRLKVCTGITISISSEFSKTLKMIYKNICSVSNDSEEEVLIKNIVMHCFFGVTNIDILFPPYSKKSCNNYFYWTPKKDSPSKMLKSKNILFVTGSPGTGKSELAKHVVTEYTTTSRYPDIGWLESTYEPLPLSKHICDIPFCRSDNKFTPIAVLQKLKQKPRTSILVLDVPALSEEDFSFIDTELRNLDLRILITTRASSVPEEYYHINLDDCPDSYMKIIFNSFSTMKLSACEFKKLLNIIEHNPYVLTLVAKTLENKDSSIDRVSLLEPENWLWKTKNLPKIHSCYKDCGTKAGMQLSTLIHRILEDYPPDFFTDRLSELSVWTKTELDINVLTGHFERNFIEQAIQYGLLRYVDQDNTQLRMPTIIADAIWDRFPVSFDMYKDEIFEFLHSIEIGDTLKMSITTIYELITNMIHRFHYQTTHMKSRVTADMQKQYFEWYGLLSNTCAYLIRLGNSKLAENLLSRLYVYASECNKTVVSLSPSLQCVRTLLNAQVKMMKSDNFFGHVSDLHGLLVDFQQVYTLKSTSAKYYKDSPILTNTLKLLHCNIVDYFIRTEKLFSVKYLFDRQKPPFDSWKLLLLLKQHMSTIFSDYYTFDECQYYQAVYNCILSLYEDRKNSLNVDIYIKNMRDFPPTNADLLFKASLQHFYYTLITYSIDSNLSELYPSNNFIDVLVNKYNMLYNDFNSKSCNSWDTKWTFYICTFIMDLFLTYRSSIYPFTKYRIDLVKESFPDFLNSQLTLSKNEIDSIKRLKQSLDSNV